MHLQHYQSISLILSVADMQPCVCLEAREAEQLLIYNFDSRSFALSFKRNNPSCIQVATCLPSLAKIYPILNPLDAPDHGDTASNNNQSSTVIFYRQYRIRKDLHHENK